MEFYLNIQEIAAKLIKQAQTLPKIKIKWEEPISIHCNELINEKEQVRNRTLEIFQDHKLRPAVYYFEITSNNSGSQIVAALSEYKNKKLRSCPKIDLERDMTTKYLYCGSRKEGLHGRFIQHIGFGSQNTYALQLCYWASDLNLELNFHYAWLDHEFKDYTELVESALANKIHPLVGKLVQ